MRIFSKSCVSAPVGKPRPAPAARHVPASARSCSPGRRPWRPGARARARWRRARARRGAAAAARRAHGTRPTPSAAERATRRSRGELRGGREESGTDGRSARASRCGTPCTTRMCMCMCMCRRHRQHARVPSASPGGKAPVTARPPVHRGARGTERPAAGGERTGLRLDRSSIDTGESAHRPALPRRPSGTDAASDRNGAISTGAGPAVGGRGGHGCRHAQSQCVRHLKPGEPSPWPQRRPARCPLTAQFAIVAPSPYMWQHGKAGAHVAATDGKRCADSGRDRTTATLDASVPTRSVGLHWRVRARARVRYGHSGICYATHLTEPRWPQSKRPEASASMRTTRR